LKLEAIKSLVDKEPDKGCWHWTGSSKVRYEGRMYYPHLLIYKIVKGITPPPATARVRHCDSPDCVRPSHYHDVPRHAPIASYIPTRATTLATDSHPDSL
jgi:hypothetical protein